MKIHFIIEFETDKLGNPERMKVRRMREVSPVSEKIAAQMQKNLEQSDVLESAFPFTPKTRRVKIAAVAPGPIPAEPEPEAPRVRQAGSGPQFDPGFLAIIRDAKEPMTRVQIAVASGLSKEDVTLRFNRMKHKGWLTQPAPGLWTRTKQFGLKTPTSESEPK